MLTPKYLQECTERLQRIAQDFEDDLITILCAALILGSEDVEADINETMYEYMAAGTNEINRVVTDSIRRNLSSETALAKAEEETSGVPAAKAVPEMTYIRRLIAHVLKVTQSSWRNMCQTVAFNAEREYVKATDKAYQKVLTGMTSRDKAAKVAVQKLGSEGITFVEGARQEHVDVAAARNLRTAVAQTAGDIVLESAKARGIDCVLVSAHLGARPTHEVWQGKVYSLKGKTDKYDDFYEATGYGTVDGLCGVNCRHTFTAWIEGMKNPFEDVDPQKSRRRYDIEQRMRYMERQIRAQRRKLAAAQGTGDQEVIAEEKAKLRGMISDYHAFCAAHDMRPLDERTKI